MKILVQVLECAPGLESVPPWWQVEETYAVQNELILVSAQKDSIVQIAGPRAVIELRGFMSRRTPRWSSRVGTEEIARWIVAVSAEDEIRHIEIHANSGGGEAGSSDPIREALDIASGRVETIETFVDGHLASAAYRAVQSYPIIATPGSWIGSIGTCVRLFDESSLLEQFFGVIEHVVASGKYKEAWAAVGVTETLLENVRVLVENNSRQFKDEVVESRNLASVGERDRQEILEGKVFPASEADRLGLVDEVRKGMIFTNSDSERGNEMSLVKKLESLLKSERSGKKGAEPRESDDRLRATLLKGARREVHEAGRLLTANLPPAVRENLLPVVRASLALDIANGHADGDEFESVLELLEVAPDTTAVELAGLDAEEEPLSSQLLTAVQASQRVAKIALGQDLATPAGEKTAPRNKKYEDVQDMPPALQGILDRFGGGEALENAVKTAKRLRLA